MRLFSSREASRSSVRLGKPVPEPSTTVECLILFGYKGTIYPVNPKADEIYGVRSYASVMDTPEVPELASDLPRPGPGHSRLWRVIGRNPPGGHHQPGFSDADSQGKALQARSRGWPVRPACASWGPNTWALQQLLTLYQRLSSISGYLEVVPTAVIGPTGVVKVAANQFAYGQAWGRRPIGHRNICDCFRRCLELLRRRSADRVSSVHMEGMLGDGSSSKRVKDNTAKTGSVLKTGRTAAGAKAALSHTGMLAGEDEVNDAAFSEAG